MKRTFTTFSILLLATIVMAQKVDFNFFGRTESQVNEIGYTSWFIPGQCISDTMVVDPVAGIKIAIANGPASKGKYIGCGWVKSLTQDVDKLIGDGLYAYTDDGSGKRADMYGPVAEVEITIWGLSAGEHSIMAYHNQPSGFELPTLDIYANGVLKAEHIAQSAAKQVRSQCGISYITFTAEEGKPVKIWYRSKPDATTTYSLTNRRSSTVFINSIVLDEANPATMANDFIPANGNEHVDADNGLTLSWTPADNTVKHHIMLGTDKNNLTQIAVTTDTTYVVKDLSSMNAYYWRIDEEDAAGTISQGRMLYFRPRHLAFPTAEGYGRFAIGGRFGSVYHVTNLSNVDEDGSLLHGLKISDPHTIVFDVSGVIDMKYNAVFIPSYVTIAGQTAPGKGICIYHSSLNVGSDNIFRHMRTVRGLGTSDDTGNALGATGADNTIIDHTSMRWGTDETFSSRNGRNLTLQRSMIAEALGIAHHRKYPDGKNHGFAATIGGNVGTFSHNLLVDCTGRNWSMGGNVDGQGKYISKMDLVNNVCYNWNGRTTDGSSAEVNFVGNYYKMGVDTKHTVLFTMNHEGYGSGTCLAYVKGNIRVNKDGSLSEDKLNDTYNAIANPGVKIDYETFVNKPLFPSYVTIHSAKDAYKSVLSDVGANQPVFDLHDQRMIRETRDRSYTYVGSLSGIKGEIDSEADITGESSDDTDGGLEIYPEETRAKDFDRDADGIPDWWETLVGTNASVDNHLADRNKDGYTDLEEYLNFMGEPHVILSTSTKKTVNLPAMFAGYTASPTFSYTNTDGIVVKKNAANQLTITAGKNTGLQSVTVSVKDREDSKEIRTMTVAIIGQDVSSIAAISSSEFRNIISFDISNAKGEKMMAQNLTEPEDIANLKIKGLPAGLYVIKGQTATGKVVYAKALMN